MSVLNVSTLNPRLLEAQYAVRGEIPIEAGKIDKDLRDKSSKHTWPFKRIIYSNIGNPQALEQKPITYFRQVLALLECDYLLDDANRTRVSELFPKDVIDKALDLKANGVRMGAYSDSQGILYLRQMVAKFITERDGQATSPDNIFLTSGASEAVSNVLFSIISHSKVGVMIPVPQYPLYSATITLFDGAAVPYFLDEEKDWGLDSLSLSEAVTKARKEGTDVRAIAIINPGNPTGQCLSREAIEEIIRFAHKEKLVILADEVYQTNAYLVDRPFFSFKKVLLGMGETYKNQELVSFHSISKGMVGECGRRGGYMELVNIDEGVKGQLLKRASISLCSNVSGQVLTGLMCQPPRKGEASFETYERELENIFSSLKRRASRLADAFNAMEGVSCNQPMGAMYLFPQIRLSSKAQKAAEAEGRAADAFYCLSLLRKTGVCVVPGSGFGQKKDTFHFRCTFLPQEEFFDDFIALFRNFQAEWVKEYGL